MADSARENYWLPLASQDERCRALSCQVWKSSGGGETAFMEAPSKTPCLWSGGGKPSCAGLRLREAEPWSPAAGTRGWPQTARGGWAQPCHQPGLPWGSMAGCHQELEEKKWLLCVSSTVVEFYGMALLFLQHWLRTNKRRQFIS